MLSNAESTPTPGSAVQPDPVARGERPTREAALDRVQAPLNFLVNTGERPEIHVIPGVVERHRTGVYEANAVPIRNGRPIAQHFSLDREGFALERHRTAALDLYDDEEVRSVYYPEIERLVKTATGASEVLIFDHTVRVEGAGGNRKAPRDAARWVHNDYTERSAPQRVHDLLDAAEAETRLASRFAQINVWRPITGPVETAPLALADAQSVDPRDLVAVDLVYSDRRGEIYEATANPAHRWFYFPRMQRDEVLLIKGYDSARDGRARFTPHSAFFDPTSPAQAAPRESIEVRTFAFFPLDSCAEM